MKVAWAIKAFKVEMMELMVNDVSKDVDFWAEQFSGQQSP